MSLAFIINELESQIPVEVKDAWELLKPVISKEQVSSRQEAYQTFSRALTISNQMGVNQKTRDIWQQFLEKGKFCIKESEDKYDFKTILSLFKEGLYQFEISWMKVDPLQDSVIVAAKELNAIALDSLGFDLNMDELPKMLDQSPIFAMLAKHKKQVIAGMYGTYVEPLQLFHFNFLGRKISFPSVKITESLKGQLDILKRNFPNIKCMTLCTFEQNDHAQALYQLHGFEQLEHVKEGTLGKPIYFYGKTLDADAILPSYQEFKQAYLLTKKNLD